MPQISSDGEKNGRQKESSAPAQPDEGANTESVRDQESLAIAKQASDLGIHDFDVLSQTIEPDRPVREIWGVERDEPFTYDRFISSLRTEDRAPTQASIDRALDPKGTGKYYAEYRVISRKDGVERWVAATGRVSFDQGRAVRIVGTVQEISER